MDVTLNEKETQLKGLIGSGQTDDAVNLLSQMAIKCAQNGDFERADAYRDRLYEVDSMALSAIVAVNEAIEAEKSKSLTPDRRRLWARFFHELSPEESNAFFFALKEVTLKGEEIVLQQGEGNDRLYLVNHGQLKMIHDRMERQALIRILGPGDTFGEQTFFSINVCTVSVVTLSETRLSFIERDKMDGITSQFPAIERSLQKICSNERKVFEWLRQKGLDRRVHNRINLNTKIWFQVLTPDDNPAMQRPVTAELWDISKSGLSFYFGSKNKKAVRRLLGRTLGVRFNINHGGKQKQIALTGIVQGVQDHPLDEYSVHVKLKRNFSDEAVRTIYRIAEEKDS
jgi:CRP-like cAMP-binding protein